VTITELSFLLVGLFLLGAAAAAPAIHATWRRALGYASELQIWEVLRREGISPDSTAGRERELVIAMHRCIACPSIAECETALASGRSLDLEAYCPNAAFVRFLRPNRGSSMPTSPR
jgi:hypothetical protein